MFCGVRPYVSSGVWRLAHVTIHLPKERFIGCHHGTHITILYRLSEQSFKDVNWSHIHVQQYILLHIDLPLLGTAAHIAHDCHHCLLIHGVLH